VGEVLIIDLRREVDRARGRGAGRWWGLIGIVMSDSVVLFVDGKAENM
jgi:hypothetical protein